MELFRDTPFTQLMLSQMMFTIRNYSSKILFTAHIFMIIKINFKIRAKELQLSKEYHMILTQFINSNQNFLLFLNPKWNYRQKNEKFISNIKQNEYIYHFIFV